MILNVSVMKESAGCLKDEWKEGHSWEHKASNLEIAWHCREAYQRRDGEKRERVMEPKGQTNTQ